MATPLRRADFAYGLPKELIAQRPLDDRTASRLLVPGGGGLRDMMFKDQPSLLRAGDLVVLNDTRMLPARLRGRKASGGSCRRASDRARLPEGAGAPVGHHLPEAPSVLPAPRPGAVRPRAAHRTARDRVGAAPSMPRARCTFIRSRVSTMTPSGPCASSPTACSASMLTVRCASTPLAISTRPQYARCIDGSAAGCCARRCAMAPSPRRSPPISPAGTTVAGSRCTPSCASKRRIAPASNACCATAPDRPSPANDSRGTDLISRSATPSQNPCRAGQTALTLAPLELLDRLAALIPPPRRHRHHYAGVFAPHANWRARVTACAAKPVTESAMAIVPQPDPARSAATRRRASISWARLLARIYENSPLSCPRCQGEMRLIAFLSDAVSIRIILAHLGESTTPPPLSPRARVSPELEAAWAGTFGFAFDQSPPWDPTTPAPDPGLTFDQTRN